MKALILAAGYGTRLRPHTRFLPKPLFTIAGKPLIHRQIQQLIAAGCSQIMVNTHHLGDQIETYFKRIRYPIPIHTRHEPEILGTAGAMANAVDFWDDTPFIVFNGDVLTDLDIRGLYRFHCGHTAPVTLAVTDFLEINSVAVDSAGNVAGFRDSAPQAIPADPAFTWRTFSGVQVVDPRVVTLIPPQQYVSSVEIYTRLIATGQPPRAYAMGSAYWLDTGTPQRYTQAAYDWMAPEAFTRAFGSSAGPIKRIPLAGDGSDRRWYRLQDERGSLIMADHGIQTQSIPSEARSYVALAGHFRSLGTPVPRIYISDTCSGLVFMEDLGDVNLQAYVAQGAHDDHILQIYGRLIDMIIDFSRRGLARFDPAWAYDTAAYDRNLIIKREGEYFINAFMNTYLKSNLPGNIIRKDLHHLADLIEAYGAVGLMHRDMQSRNIMMCRKLPCIIDFQGARPGPLQYDLASLLIDPYVQLPASLQKELQQYAAERYADLCGWEPRRFNLGYEACALARNLQILGAYGFLTSVKGKHRFAKYIPRAVATLYARMNNFGSDEFPQLREIVNNLNKSAVNPG